MNYAYARSKFKHKGGFERDAKGNIVTQELKIDGVKARIRVRNVERMMHEPSESNSIPSKPASKQRAKRRRLNPERRTVEENRRAR